MINRVRVRVARSERDPVLEEELRLENIEMEPSDAQPHGSYADVLRRERRVEDAVA